jgi:phage terminase large subunit
VFAQRLTVQDTGAMTPAEQAEELQAYIADFGNDQGEALFCRSICATLMRQCWARSTAREMRLAESQGRICEVPYDDKIPVYTAWDIGFSDDTAIWFYQVVRGEIHVIDYYAANGYGVEHYAMC